MSFGNEDEEIKQLKSMIEKLIESHNKLLELIILDFEQSSKLKPAMANIDKAIVSFLAKNTDFESSPEYQEILEISAAVKKELEAGSTKLILQNLLPPLPPGTPGGIAPGA
jgi:hypothetical protein